MDLTVHETSLRGVLLVDLPTFRDDRGTLCLAMDAATWRSAGLPDEFARELMSSSRFGTLRGLHASRDGGTKVVSVVSGYTLDVVVDVRRDSPTFGKHVSFALSETKPQAVVIAPGFAHGFAVTGAPAVVSYRITTPYDPTEELGIAWNDPELAIAWPSDIRVISDADRRHARLRDVSLDWLPLIT